MPTFLRILKTVQQVLCVSKNTYYEIENLSAWSYSHLGDTTLPISVEIQTKLLNLVFTMFSSKNNFCPDVFLYPLFPPGLTNGRWGDQGQ